MQGPQGRLTVIVALLSEMQMVGVSSLFLAGFDETGCRFSFRKINF